MWPVPLAMRLTLECYNLSSVHVCSTVDTCHVCECTPLSCTCHQTVLWTHAVSVSALHCHVCVSPDSTVDTCRVCECTPLSCTCHQTVLWTHVMSVSALHCHVRVTRQYCGHMSCVWVQSTVMCVSPDSTVDTCHVCECTLLTCTCHQTVLWTHAMSVSALYWHVRVTRQYCGHMPCLWVHSTVMYVSPDSTVDTCRVCECTLLTCTCHQTVLWTHAVSVSALHCHVRVTRQYCGHMSCLWVHSTDMYVSPDSTVDTCHVCECTLLTCTCHQTVLWTHAVSVSALHCHVRVTRQYCGHMSCLWVHSTDMYVSPDSTVDTCHVCECTLLTCTCHQTVLWTHAVSVSALHCHVRVTRQYCGHMSCVWVQSTVMCVSPDSTVDTCHVCECTPLSCACHQTVLWTHVMCVSALYCHVRVTRQYCWHMSCVWVHSTVMYVSPNSAQCLFCPTTRFCWLVFNQYSHHTCYFQQVLLSLSFTIRDVDELNNWSASGLMLWCVSGAEVISVTYWQSVTCEQGWCDVSDMLTKVMWCQCHVDKCDVMSASCWYLLLLRLSTSGAYCNHHTIIIGDNDQRKHTHFIRMFTTHLTHWRQCWNCHNFLNVYDVHIMILISHKSRVLLSCKTSFTGIVKAIC